MMKRDKKKGAFGLGLMLTGVLAAVGATAIALIKKKQREEVYHEAELKAMSELDDLMAETDAEDCENCSLGDACAAEADEVPDVPAQDDAEEEPIEDVADLDTDEEKPEA